MTVQELRNLGYKVRVLHIRNRIYKPRMDTSINGVQSPKGGITHIIIDSPSGEHFEGIARCSEIDNYNKKLGVRIAIGRSGVCATR
jgi:hypothetical protein